MIQQQLWQGIPVYTMQTEQLSASLCPSLGNNLYRLWDIAGQREVLRVPDHPDQLKHNPIHYGTPMMVPPNRIRHGKFHFRGKEYAFDINMPNGHHIHGLIKNLPWTVSSFAEEEAGACTIRSTFATSDFPEVVRQYPHDLHMEMTYTLKDSTLLQKVTITNRGTEAAPFGFGLHTWFMIDSEPEQWKLKLPVSSLWELDSYNIPTGQLLPLTPYEALSQGMQLKGINLDTVFHVSEQPNTAILSKEGCEIRYSTNEAYKHWVIYTMGEADKVICLEPYTWVTNAPNLELDPGITGMLAIEAGQSLQLEVVLDIIHKS